MGCYWRWQKLSSFSQNLKNKMKLTFRRKEFQSLSDFEFIFSNASDFEIKISKRVRFWFKSFTKRQNLDWKIKRVRFWVQIFSTCQVLKNCLHKKNTFWFILLRENGIFRIFGAFLKAWFWNETFENASHFNLKVLQRVRFGIEKKTFSKSYWTCHVFLLKKHKTWQSQLKLYNHWETNWRVAASSCASED